MPDFTTIAPYGIGIVAIVALFFLGFTKKTLVVGAIIVAIIVIVLVDEILKPMVARPADKVLSAPPAPPSSTVSWVDTNVLGDWGDRDRITPLPPTNGSPVPIYETKDGVKLCDENQVGVVAVCWEKEVHLQNSGSSCRDGHEWSETRTHLRLWARRA